MLENMSAEGLLDTLPELLPRSCAVKASIVEADEREEGNRKALNFGHTIGHVIEGYYMNILNLSHGHAIAIGMLMEAFLSLDNASLSQEEYKHIEKFITSNYEIPNFTDEAITSMIEMLRNDKKNKNDKILTSLISEIGVCKYDVEISETVFLQTFKRFKIN
jgi:3-dehydroquinate synthase